MKGIITVYNIREGVWSPITTVNNSILYSGWDLTARAIAGDSTAVVNGMYMQYKNAAPSLPTIELDRTPEYYTSLTGDDGYVRTSTLTNPQFSASTTSYVTNVVSFHGVSDGTSSGGVLVLDGISQFYSLALVAIPDIQDITKDVLFSAGNIVDGTGALAPITKIANSQIGIRWSIKFGD